MIHPSHPNNPAARRRRRTPMNSSAHNSFSRINARFAARASSFALAALMTLATLGSIDRLANFESRAAMAQELAAAQAAQRG